MKLLPVWKMRQPEITCKNGVHGMKILGAGLSKTGTSSLHQALQILGYTALHYDTTRLNDILDGSNTQPDFCRYDDYDAVTDLPAAYFYRELLAAYPECKVILTIRDVDDWWKSAVHHFNVRFPVPKPRRLYQILDILGIKKWPGMPPFREDKFLTSLRNYVYGSITATEFLYKKRYQEHNAAVQATVPPQQLLVMNIIQGDGWETLCPFLHMPIPDVPFPHENKGGY